MPYFMGFLFLLYISIVTDAKRTHIPRQFSGMSVGGSCPERCCCKVCSDPEHPSYPYGKLTDEANRFQNPWTPSVQGSTCYVPVWKDSVCGFTDRYGQRDPSCVQALWWKYQPYFEDSAYHSAPSTCHCCRRSGVDTSCSEDVPRARRPTSFALEASPVAGSRLVIRFTGGVSMGKADRAELRNDTHCGYGYPPPVRQSHYLNATTSLGTESKWTISKLPEAKCYRLCYLHGTLTTPTWYDMGTVFVLAKARTPITRKVYGAPLVYNPIQIQVSGGSVYDIFSDIVELRPAGTTCGQPGFVVRSDTMGLLKPQGEQPWCHPPIVPSLTRFRPTRYVDVTYNMCPVKDRLKSQSVQWDVTVPSAGNYTLCYQMSTFGTWTRLGFVNIYPKKTAREALLALYDNTRGTQWLRASNWGSSSTVSVCTWYGIRCDVNGDVNQIILNGNNLDGTIPVTFLTGPWHKVTYLSLGSNNIGGTLPGMIGALVRLEHLDLSINRMTGPVPEELGTVPLITMYLSENKFTGQLPYNLRSLVDLRQVWADSNPSLTAVEVPQPLQYRRPPPVPSRCPMPDLICPDEGSTSPGSNECGYDGISETECIVRGCCFNAQAPLVFGGKTCFTKVKASRFRFPPCTGLTPCKPK